MQTSRDAVANGAIPQPRTPDEMRRLLSSCGLTPSGGDTHHISVAECSHFVFRENGREGYLLSADAESLDELLRDAALVSGAFSRAGVEHRFEVYDAQDRLVRTLAYPASAHEV
jgi:hypothetical protein